MAITKTAEGATALSKWAAAEHLEVTGVFAACHGAGVPLGAVLGVADRVGPEAHAEWKVSAEGTPPFRDLLPTVKLWFSGASDDAAKCEGLVELFEDQARSGLSAAEYCRDHGLSPQYFSSRKKALVPMETAAEPSPFIRLEPIATRAFPASVPQVRLRLGRCECELTDIPLDEVVHLMQALA